MVAVKSSVLCTSLLDTGMASMWTGIQLDLEFREEVNLGIAADRKGQLFFYFMIER